MSELIDRGDVLGVISCFFEDSFIEDADVNCAELEREINRLPTIDAVPVRHGEWIEREKCFPDIDRQLDYRYECSVCGFSDIHNSTLNVPYCWHCGARMDGGEHDLR